MSWLGALDRKLLRDLFRMRGQAIAIAVIVASGVAVLASSLAVVDALGDSARAFYERQHFGHVFASAVRAPRRLVTRISRIPGVQAAEARVVELATLDIAGFTEPVVGTLLSLPTLGEAAVNRPLVTSGRAPSPHAPSEVLVNEPFAEAHDLEPGDRFHALINGHRRVVTVTGTALSPEFVYAMGPGALLPDPLRYGVLWMPQKALEAAFDLDGAFNDVSLTLTHGADVDAVIRQLDDLLARYGGTGAIARKNQISNWFVMNEIAQLRSMAGILPTIFLAVAAFLTNMVLARLIATERAEIGLIKAFGYSDASVAAHYLKLVLMMTGAGVVLGWVWGWWLGYWTTELYAALYRFPVIVFEPGSGSFLVAGAVSLGAAVLGGLSSVRRAAKLPPAEAMRPPAPETFHGAGALTRWLRNVLDQLTRIVFRQIIRWPLRAFLTSLGVASSVAVLMMALQWTDALDYMIEEFFIDQQRQDITVGLLEDQPLSVRHSFSRLPGVLGVEAQRAVPARLRHGTRTKREGITGVTPGAQLAVFKDAAGNRIHMPPAGLVLSRPLAEILDVGVGDQVTVEVLEGRRPVVSIPVAALFDTPIGIPAYMSLDALNRALGDPPLANILLLRADPAEFPALFKALKETPVVGAVTLRKAAITSFNDTIAENILVSIAIYVGFACTLAAGVVYNSMRIALSERAREMATLRVLGFRHTEVSYLLLGEVGLLVWLALPLGCALGFGLVQLMSRAFKTELFRIEPVVEPETLGVALVVTLGTSLVCAALIHQRVAHLDLIRVLKTRE